MKKGIFKGDVMPFDSIINTRKKNAPLGAIVGAVPVRAARRKQLAIPPKNSPDVV